MMKRHKSIAKKAWTWLCIKARISQTFYGAALLCLLTVWLCQYHA